MDTGTRNRLFPGRLTDGLAVEAVYYGGGTLFICGLAGSRRTFSH
jgi:hypothetical protein